MRKTTNTQLVGTVMVLVTWKYKGEAELRRKVHMMPEDYYLLRRLLTGVINEQEIKEAEGRNTFVSLNSISTDISTVADVEHISMLQLIGHIATI